MKGFWNDKNGLTLNELIAVMIITTFLLITGWEVYLNYIAKLDSVGLELYKAYIAIPVAVVSGLFLQGTAKEVWGKKKQGGEVTFGDQENPE